MNPKPIVALILIVSGLSLTCGFGYTFPAKQLNVSSTAYTHAERSHSEWANKTASGSEVTYSEEYTSAAADWSWLPLGTEFRIDGVDRTFVVDDYGSALVGKETIDIYFPSQKMVDRWGLQQVDIVVTKYGDFEKSAEVLRGHAKYSDKWHVKEMLESIQKNAAESLAENQVRTEKKVPLIRKWWRKKGHVTKVQASQPTLDVVSNDSLGEIVEPPYPDQNEWEGDPFKVAYAAPVIDPIVKVRPIKPLSESPSFYYGEKITPVRRDFRVVHKRFNQ